MPNLIKKIKTKLSRKNLQKQLVATKELLDIYVKNNEHLRREGIIARARNTSLELKIQDLFQEKTDLLREIMDLKNEIRGAGQLVLNNSSESPVFTEPGAPPMNLDESIYELPSFSENVIKNSSSGYNSEILCDFGQKYGLETGTILVRENTSGSGAHLETNIRSASVSKVYDNVHQNNVSNDEILNNINKFSKEFETMQKSFKNNCTFLTEHQVLVDMTESDVEADESMESSFESRPNFTRNEVKTSSKNSSKIDHSLDSHELSKIDSRAELLQFSILEEIKNKASRNNSNCWTILSRREGSDFMFNKNNGGCKVRFSYAL